MDNFTSLILARLKSEMDIERILGTITIDVNCSPSEHCLMQSLCLQICTTIPLHTLIRSFCHSSILDFLNEWIVSWQIIKIFFSLCLMRGGSEQNTMKMIFKHLLIIHHKGVATVYAARESRRNSANHNTRVRIKAEDVKN
jgi:hypothetical protein